MMADLTILATVLTEHFFRLVIMVVLLGCSAFFSGSETAFFHLSRRTVRQFAHSTVRLEQLVSKILYDPNRFLTALLFGNMAVNVLFFSVSSTLMVNLSKTYGGIAATIAGIITFFSLLLFGEMLPKSIAFMNAKRFCLLASPACYLLLTVLRPLLKIIDVLVVQSTIRLFVHPHPTRSISLNQLGILLDSSRREGLINNEENQLLTEILKFAHLKVRHVMLPRVQMPACAVSQPVRTIRQQMLDHKISKISVYTSDIDHVVGVIYLRDVIDETERSAAAFVRKVHFVPEQKSVESLIEFFRQSRTDYAVVVDEYGGVAGYVDLEDIAEQLLGPMEEDVHNEPIEQIGPMQYRLHANLSIADWGDAFGIEIAEGRLTTIGGFVTALLEKIPRPEDSVTFGNMRFTVENVTHNRIHTIVLTVEPLTEEGGKTS